MKKKHKLEWQLDPTLRTTTQWMQLIRMKEGTRLYKVNTTFFEMAHVDVTATNHQHFIFPVRELVVRKEEFQVHEVQIHGSRLIFNTG